MITKNPHRPSAPIHPLPTSSPTPPNTTTTTAAGKEGGIIIAISKNKIGTSDNLCHDETQTPEKICSSFVIDSTLTPPVSTSSSIVNKMQPITSVVTPASGDISLRSPPLPVVTGTTGEGHGVVKKFSSVVASVSVDSQISHGHSLPFYKGIFEGLNSMLIYLNHQKRNDYFDDDLRQEEELNDVLLLKEKLDTVLLSNVNLPRPLKNYIHILNNVSSIDGVKRRRFYLCRHGETEPNLKRVLQGSGLDESLNETGN